MSAFLRWFVVTSLNWDHFYLKLMDNKIFKYNGTDVTFQLGDGSVMVVI